MVLSFIIVNKLDVYRPPSALTAPPLETAPKFLKASKQDKATVQQQPKKNKHLGLRPSKKDKLSGNPPPKPIPKKSPLRVRHKQTYSDCILVQTILAIYHSPVDYLVYIPAINI
ncbi:hypothetical protein [Anabaena catenula]|uniref:Uncharacterized protein n=1 Tax=Anabaena catenula FACHB-362 TaxID=2692877 RepID=A0ABR8J7P8_9NOST|nr:hypothetical protein [Anabaena catenula FACHB-362]